MIPSYNAKKNGISEDYLGYRPLIRRICLRGVLESRSYNKEFVFWAGVAGKVAQIGQFHGHIPHQ